MKKFLYIVLLIACPLYLVSYASDVSASGNAGNIENSGLGIVIDDDLIKVGVKKDNIDKAKAMIDKVSTNYKLLLLEKRQAELEVNKYVLEGTEKNLSKIDELFDKMGQIEASILKIQIRSQVEMKQYITQDQYMAAREIAMKRLYPEENK